MLESVPGTNQCLAIRVKFLAQGNNRCLKFIVLKLMKIDRFELMTDKHPPITSQVC